MGVGGKRVGAGRKPGIPNKATATLREAAREYTDMALKTLAEIARKGTSEQARVLAADKLLDRAYGKATQINEHGGMNGDPEIKVTLNDTERAAKVLSLLKRVAKSG
jgi:hypothetical protein